MSGQIKQRKIKGYELGKLTAEARWGDSRVEAAYHTELWQVNNKVEQGMIC